MVAPDFARAAVALTHAATALAACKASAPTVAGVVRKFHAELRNLVTLGFVSDSSILADMRRLVKQGVEDAYFAGLAEGGVSADEASADDALMVVELNTQQQDHITDFVRAIRAAKDDKAAQRDILNNRVNLWTASIEAAGMQGLASAKANAMGEWVYGDTDHCDTCAGLNGKRHRLKWFTSHGYIPREPGSRTLDCHGFRCQCRIVDADGNQLM